MIQELAIFIERYLESTPVKSDSVAGITRMILLRSRYQISNAQIQEALNLLERKGVVERMKLRGRSDMYRIR